MRDRALTILALLVALTFLLLLIQAIGLVMPLAAQTRPAAKPWTLSKTPWGDPDLQGTYTSDDCIGAPMNRPANLGDKRYYTEEELAQAESRIARQAEADKQEFVASNAVETVNPPGHWGERARRPCKQTSLVVDPPDGRTPALTPEAQARGGRGQRGGGGDAIAAQPAPAQAGQAGAPPAAAQGGRGGGGGNNNPANQPGSW